jgi:hypothetical protein
VGQGKAQHVMTVWVTAGAGYSMIGGSVCYLDCISHYIFEGIMIRRVPTLMWVPPPKKYWVGYSIA